MRRSKVRPTEADNNCSQGEHSEQGASPNPSAALVCLLWFACYYPSELFWSVCLMRMKTAGSQQPPGMWRLLGLNVHTGSWSEDTFLTIVTPLFFYFPNHFFSHVIPLLHLPCLDGLGHFSFSLDYLPSAFLHLWCFFILCDQKFLSVNSLLYTFDVRGFGNMFTDLVLWITNMMWVWFMTKSLQICLFVLGKKRCSSFIIIPPFSQISSRNVWMSGVSQTKAVESREWCFIKEYAWNRLISCDIL